MPRKSWLAHISAGLGLSALLGVLCFHFPELLTSRDFRAVYSETFARQLLLFGIHYRLQIVQDYRHLIQYF